MDRPTVPGITWPSSDEGPSVGCSREFYDVRKYLKWWLLLPECVVNSVAITCLGIQKICGT